MIYFAPVEDSLSGLICQVPADSLVIFRITVDSCFSTPALLQPRFETWNDGTRNIPDIPVQIQPTYNYLSPGMKHTMSVSLQLPENLPAGTVLRSNLRFSGFKDCLLPVELTLSEKDPSSVLFLEEREFTLPLTGSTPGNASAEDRRMTANIFFTDSVTSLLSGMEALEKIPSRWLVTEIILAIADNGRHLAEKEEMREIIRKLRRTIFYKNGSLVTAGSQILHWLSTTHSITSNLNALSGNQQSEQPRMLYNWEKWIFNLMHEDIEHDAAIKSDIQFEPPQPFEVLLKAIDNKPEKLFLYFIIGLMEISPRLKDVIRQLTNNIPDQEKTDPVDAGGSAADILSEDGSLQR
jgi:hypothetical protein